MLIQLAYDVVIQHKSIYFNIPKERKKLQSSTTLLNLTAHINQVKQNKCLDDLKRQNGIIWKNMSLFEAIVAGAGIFAGKFVDL